MASTIKDAVEDVAEELPAKAKKAGRKAAEAANDVAEDLQDDAEDAIGTLRRKAADVRDAAVSAGHDMGERVSDTAAHLRDQASARAAEARDSLTDGGDRLAKTLRRAAKSNDGPVPSRVLSSAADGVAYATDHLRGSTLTDITGGIKRAARRNPGLFAAGAALAGFALARMLMPSRDDTDHE